MVAFCMANFSSVVRQQICPSSSRREAEQEPVKRCLLTCPAKPVHAEGWTRGQRQPSCWIVWHFSIQAGSGDSALLPSRPPMSPA